MKTKYLDAEIERLNLLERTEELSDYGREKLLEFKAIKQVLTNAIKSLPNEEQVKAWIEGLPYYGSCTTEYNEGFEEGVRWVKEQ
jgi:hypothetical protein